MGVCEKRFILDLIEIKFFWGVNYVNCLIPLHVSGFGVSIFFIELHFSQDGKLFVGSGLGQVPDNTPCLWFLGFPDFLLGFFSGLNILCGGWTRAVA